MFTQAANRFCTTYLAIFRASTIEPHVTRTSRLPFPVTIAVFPFPKHFACNAAR
jgi:hypothetical protein